MDITCKHRIENKHESGHSSQKLGSLCRPQTSCITHVLITLCRFWPVNYIFWPKEMYVALIVIHNLSIMFKVDLTQVCWSAENVYL